MSWLSRLFSRPTESKMTSEQLWREIYGGRESSAGVEVNSSRALEVATVLACCRVVANGVAQVPWKLFRARTGGREVADAHPVYPLIYRAPNAYQTSFEFREQIMFHVLLTGNAFVWKGMAANGRVVTLEAVEPRRVVMSHDETLNETRYRVRADNGVSREFGPAEIWHIRGPSWNGWAGMEAVKLARDAIGLAIATENSQAKFHKGGAKVSGVLSVDDKLSSERFNLLSAWLDKHSEGGDRQGKPLILDHGASWVTTQMTGVDAQHLETRKHQIEEICRALGVFPQMVGHAGDQSPTFASAEAFFTAHVVHTLAPWYERLEQSADMNLLSDQDRASGHYTKFVPNALMRGSARDRSDYYATALGAGGQAAWMTQNEVRQLEEMDPVEGGDVLSSGAMNTGDDSGNAGLSA